MHMGRGRHAAEAPHGDGVNANIHAADAYASLRKVLEDSLCSVHIDAALFRLSGPLFASPHECCPHVTMCPMRSSLRVFPPLPDMPLPG